jgi:hypothetical protein
VAKPPAQEQKAFTRLWAGIAATLRKSENEVK